MSYSEVLTAQHRVCDAEFTHIEQAAHLGDWRRARQAAQIFIDDTEAHFRNEEQVLFPALEAAAPTAVGPTGVMRAEHAQMRELFQDLLQAIERQDADSLSDSVETLLLLMQQHNAKEENVLYPMADRVLAPDLLARLDRLPRSG